MSTFKHTVQELAKREAGKSQVNIAQLSEVCGSLRDFLAEKTLLGAIYWLVEFRRTKKS